MQELLYVQSACCLVGVTKLSHTFLLLALLHFGKACGAAAYTQSVNVD